MNLFFLPLEILHEDLAVNWETLSNVQYSFTYSAVELREQCVNYVQT